MEAGSVVDCNLGRDSRLASRKAEEAAFRQFEAATWLEKMAGPLGLPSQPTEQEFVSCLKNGLVLCNIINKIQPGAVPKVISNQSLTLAWENQTLPAYQFFENIRNFLVAVNELKIPSFEASDIERDTMEAGSVGKIVDCILGLKAYHEWKQSSEGNGLWKFSKSPMISHSKARTQPNIPSSNSSVRCLEMSTTSEQLKPLKLDDQRTEGEVDVLVKAIVDNMFSSKENINQNIFDSWNERTVDPLKLFYQIISTCLQNQQLKSIEGSFVNGNTKIDVSKSDIICKCCTFCLGKASCNHWKLVESQETKLEVLKTLLSETKLECATLQSQMQNDLRKIGCQVKRLSVAAEGYHRAIKENRDLHNMLQELRGNIQVFCRVRPALGAGVKCSIDYIGNDGTLIILDSLKSQSRKVFQFNKVFGPNATQERFYKETQSLIRSVMDGYNVCIFAYGQTGSGKTYSMCGPETGPAKDIGINGMALNDLFQISCASEDIKYEIHVQMVEIYNEQVRDLLSEVGSTAKLEIRNCSSNDGLSLPDATMHHVLSTSDVVNLMKAGEKNRASSCTTMNSRSSRSHSILTIHVCGRDVLGHKLQSCLHLVDLAGSERVDRSEVTGDRMKEAQYINKSLSCLGDVIAALAQKSSHIPYRNSKLTQLLQNSLGGHAKMLMLAHVSPEAESYGETISTLKFAQRVSSVELGAAHVNKEGSEICELREQIDSLKKELASKEHLKVAYMHKMKENTPLLERENNTEERKLPLKTPLPRTKFSTGQSLMQFRRFSLETSKLKNNQSNMKNSDSDHLQIEAEQLKHVDHEELKEDSTIQMFRQVNDLERRLSICSPSISTSPSVSQLPLGSRSGYMGEFVTPDTDNTKLKSSSTLSSSKGSQHIKKSLQTIGKLINGSEKRNHQVSSVMPSFKHNTDLHSVKKSPATVESRYRRRQSLTNVQPIEIKGSRRSSLGGKPVESYPTFGLAVPRTPVAVPASTRSAKAWF